MISHTAIAASASAPTHSASLRPTVVVGLGGGEAFHGVVVEPEAAAGHVGQRERGALGLRQQARHLGHHPAQHFGTLAGFAQASAHAVIGLDPLLGDGLGRAPDVELGVERAGHALHHHHGLLQQQQLGPRLHIEHIGVGEQLAQQVGHGDLGGRAAVDRLADGAHGLREHLHGMMRRHVAGLEVDECGAAVVAGDEAVQDLGQEAALHGAEPAHDAEVDGDDGARLVDQQVALVHVGVEEAVAHGVAQERAQDREAQRLQVVAGGNKRGAIRDRHAVDPFQRQHALGGAAPVDAGHAQAAVGQGLVAGDVVGHLGDGGGLQAQVHLDLDAAGERVDHGHRAQPPRRRQPALDLAGGEDESVEVAAEALLDAGAQDLHGHVAAHAVVDGDGLVHLGDGGGGDGRAERGEVVLQPAAQLLLDCRACLLHRERRQLVLQMAEVAGQLGADQVGAGGEELAELDVAGPQAGQRAGDAPLLGLADAERPGQRADRQRGGAGEMQDKRHLGPGRHEAHAVLGQHDAGARQAEDVADAGSHGPSYAGKPVKAPPYSSGGERPRDHRCCLLLCMHTQVGGGGHAGERRSGSAATSFSGVPRRHVNEFRKGSG